MGDEESVLRIAPCFWLESQGTMFDRFTHATGKVLVSIVKLLMTPNDDVLVESLGSYIVMDRRRKGIEVVETTSSDYTFNAFGEGKN